MTVVSATPRAGAQTLSSAGYEDLLETYRADREDAIARIGVVGGQATVDAAKALRDRLRRDLARLDPRVPGQRARLKQIRRILITAALFHTDAFSNEAIPVALHFAAADQAVRLIGTMPPLEDEPRHVAREVVRDWYAVMLLDLQQRGQFTLLDEIEREAVGRFPADTEILGIAGAVEELFGSGLVAWRDGRGAEGGRRSEVLRSRRLERAIQLLERAAVDPRWAVEARLRRTQCLLAMDRNADARTELEALTTTDASPRLQYVAQLLRARAFERSHDHTGALEQYRQATESWPSWQSAYIGLARLAALHDQVDASTTAIRMMLAQPAPPDEDPWRSYFLGFSWRFDECVRRLRAHLETS
ncbi:MAG: tetratricopeptide repeat protein [Vicinamibacterales bacterium]